MLIPFIDTGLPLEPWWKPAIEAAIDYLLSEGVELSDSGSRGGYLSTHQPFGDRAPRLQRLVACGTFPLEKNGPYMYNCQEKAWRLNKFLTLGHKTSRQSEDSSKGEFPGAIYFDGDGLIYSFSGLKPVWDEFLSVLGSCLKHCSDYRTGFYSKNIYPVFKKSLVLIPVFLEEKKLVRGAIQAAAKAARSSVGV